MNRRMVPVPFRKLGIVALAVALASAYSSNAQLTITAQTPPPSADNKPNTLVAQSQSFAASLLPSGDDLVRIPYTARNHLHEGLRCLVWFLGSKNQKGSHCGQFMPRDDV